MPLLDKIVICLTLFVSSYETSTAPHAPERNLNSSHEHEKLTKESFKYALVELSMFKSESEMMDGTEEDDIVTCVEQDLRRVTQIIDELTTRTEDLDVIVFPEYAIGYYDGWASAIRSGPAVAFQLDEKVRQSLKMLASSHRIYLILSTVTGEKEGDDEKFFNSALVFDRSGNIILNYHKKISIR